MSVKVMSWVFEHSRSTLADRLVLLAIADHANHDGVDAWPSIDQIARKAHVGRRTVFRSLENLVALGELKVFHKGGPNGKNSYQVNPSGEGADLARCQFGTVPSCPDTVPNLHLRPLYLNHPEPSLGVRTSENALDGVRGLSEMTPTATLKRGEPIR